MKYIDDMSPPPPPPPPPKRVLSFDAPVSPKVFIGVVCAILLTAIALGAF